MRSIKNVKGQAVIELSMVFSLMVFSMIFLLYVFYVGYIRIAAHSILHEMLVEEALLQSNPGGWPRLYDCGSHFSNSKSNYFQRLASLPRFVGPNSSGGGHNVECRLTRIGTDLRAEAKIPILPGIVEKNSPLNSTPLARPGSVIEIRLAVSTLADWVPNRLQFKGKF